MVVDPSIVDTEVQTGSVEEAQAIGQQVQALPDEEQVLPGHIARRLRSMKEFEEKAPEVYKATLTSLTNLSISAMRKHQKRMKEISRENNQR